MKPRSFALRSLALLTASVTAAAPAAGQSLVCPQTSPAASWAGPTLNTGTPVKSGVIFDGTSSRLRLEKAAGVFRSTTLGISDLTVYAAVADFDRDGWDDFVGVGEDNNSPIRIYRNFTFQNPAPDWDDPNQVRTPKFLNVRELGTMGGRKPIAAADFNGDGWTDVFVGRANADQNPDTATLFLNQASNDGSGNPRFQSGYAAMASGTSPSAMGLQNWGGTSVVATDYNGDRKIDLLVGSGTNNGTIRIFLNNCTLMSPQPTPLPPADKPLRCSGSPKFTNTGTLITNMGFSGSGNLAVFAYTDLDGDGKPDLVAGSPACCSSASSRLRLWKGTDGGGLASTPQSITFTGAATTILAADFSGDGRKDLIVGTDNWNYNSGNGGNSYYWVNNGSATPFSSASQQLTSTNNPTYDFDVGFVFDYDHDPSSTPDVMIADGNHTASFYVLANRVVNQYVPCGEVASGILDLGDLADSEMVVTAARIRPDAILNGGTLRYFLSNEDPPNWVEATTCSGSTTDLCASFPKPVGREVRWKAVMCSNSARTRTPELRGMQLTFDFTEAREHFRAGVVIHDGVAYAGGFRQPGDRGHLFAVNAGLNQTYWDAADAIDAVSDGARRIYTANLAGNTRLDFTTANADNVGLQTTLQVTDSAQAAAVVAWVRSARFGVGNAGIDRSRLGAIETSSPAILSKPSFPLWYVYASALDRARHTDFQASNANRRNLVLFGSKDGMVHAIQTNPAAIASAPSGTEAWAFVPPKVASGMLADYTASLGGTLTIRSYPDGSPTLADYKRSDGTFGTAAIISAGNGGQSLAALDVTRTVDPSNGQVFGPTPLWTATPGQGDAGMGHAKPSVARVLVGSRERYYVIAATGLAPDNPAPPWQKGRVVAAYDLATGELAWQFKAACPITSDITVFETDDELEPGAPTFNGYVDRAVFADACGNVYKVDPAKDLDGGWNDNRDLGSILVDTIDGARQAALFSTRQTPGALGADSPIAGTLAARSDQSSRLVLFFGTGGLESHATTATNEFYAVYADTGAIRSKLTGACSNGRCEKFYGGVVVTPEQVIFTRTTDPAIGSGTCDLGATRLQAMDLNPGNNTAFSEDFSLALASAVMGAVYGDAGAIYFATLSGDISRVGTPRAPTAGGDSGGTTPPQQWGQGSENTGGTATIGTSDPLTMLGWRQVY